MWRAAIDLLFPAQCAACRAFGSGFCDACAVDAPPLRTFAGGLRVCGYGGYEGALRAAILALKDGRRDVAEALGDRLARCVARGALLVPVPTTRRRVRARGMDGVELMARRAAAAAGASVIAPLVQRAGAQQGRSRRARLAARGRFACAGELSHGARVTLIDDVCTTGATLADCARAIAAAGGCVEGAVVAAVAKPPAPWEPQPHPR